MVDCAAGEMLYRGVALVWLAAWMEVRVWGLAGGSRGVPVYKHYPALAGPRVRGRAGRAADGGRAAAGGAAGRPAGGGERGRGARPGPLSEGNTEHALHCVAAVALRNEGI